MNKNIILTYEDIHDMLKWMYTKYRERRYNCLVNFDIEQKYWVFPNVFGVKRLYIYCPENKKENEIAYIGFCETHIDNIDIVLQEYPPIISVTDDTISFTYNRNLMPVCEEEFVLEIVNNLIRINEKLYREKELQKSDQ